MFAPMFASRRLPLCYFGFLRSSELALVGYDHGLFGCYIEGYTPTAASAGNRTRRCQLSVLASFATD